MKSPLVSNQLICSACHQLINVTNLVLTNSFYYCLDCWTLYYVETLNNNPFKTMALMYAGWLTVGSLIDIQNVLQQCIDFVNAKYLYHSLAISNPNYLPHPNWNNYIKLPVINAELN